MPPRKPKSSAPHTHASTPSGKTSKGKEQTQEVTKKAAQPKASPQGAANRPTARTQPLERGQKSTPPPPPPPPPRQSLRQKKGEKGGAVSQNEQLTGEPDSLNHQLDSNNVEPKNPPDALQHEEESSKVVAEETRKPEEGIVQLGEPHQRAIDESATLSQSLGQEQEANAVTQQSLHQEKGEEGEVVSQNEQLTGEPDGLNHRPDSNDIEPKNPQNALQHEEESSKKATEEIRKPGEDIVQPRESHQRVIDESPAFSQSLGQEQKANAATRRSPRRQKGKKDNHDVEPKNSQNALQHEEEPSKAAEEIHKPKEEVVQLKESHQRAIDGSTQSLGQEQEANAVTRRSPRRQKGEKDNHDVEPRNPQNGLQHEEEPSRAAEEIHKPKEEVVQLGESHQGAINEATAFSQSLGQEKEANAAIRRSPRRQNGEKKDSNDVEPKNLRDAPQHEEGSSKRAVEKVRKPEKAVVQLGESHQGAIDGSTAFSQSLGQEQKTNAATRQFLRRQKGEIGRVVPQNQRPTGELDGLRLQLESKDVDLKNLRSTLQQEKESFKGAVDENRKLKEEVAKLKASHQKAVDESTALSRSFKREREDKVAELNGLRSALQQSQTKHDELVTLLETRSRELKGAQVYLTKADALSGAEVISMVDALNVEILQMSAFISESFSYAREPAHADEIKAASARISQIIGSTLTRLITTASHSDRDLLVQIALQSVAVEFSHRMIITWDLDSLQVKQPLVKLYGDIRETETQAVGGRWRALTRAHAQRVALREGNPHGTMVARIANALAAVVVAAGCTKSHEEVLRTFTHDFGEHISGIVKIALRLNKAMGEEVTSADLNPVSVTSGKMFDGSTMANFESRREDLKGQAVLCTTALGMQRSEKVVRGDAVEFKTIILVKPKVVVELVVDAVAGVTR